MALAAPAVLAHADAPSIEPAYHRRRLLLRAGAVAAGFALAPSVLACNVVQVPALLDGEQPNSWEQITRYNNYHEFSSDKKAVVHLATGLRMQPWSVRIDGEVERPQSVEVSELVKSFPQIERTLRLRCVEGWSKVVPWGGFSLCALLHRVRPTAAARYVQFTALNDPSQMIGQRLPSLEWPYTEALTLAEAMHPLTMLATGLHGKPLPPSSGGPIRLVVPWKYGYKSIKAIVHIRLTNERPQGTWSRRSPDEYGFYGNVHPQVPHPRWSQSREVRIGEVQKRATLLYNGYADAVAGLYVGLDPLTHR